MIIVKNGRVIDPANGVDEIRDVYIKDGKIAEPFNDSGAEIIDAAGRWVVPGLIDVHVHLREPGFENKETIATGTAAAARGGFTTVCCMPNTNPVIDNEILVEYVKLKAEREGKVNVLPIGAITKGQKGEELSNIGLMAKAGAAALSEDGKTVKNAALLKTAMKYAGMFGLPILSHCEDADLVGGGQINAGETAARLGLSGISADSEEVIIARDIILAKSVGARLHICHLSVKGGAELVRLAKSGGQNVTAEVTPHHFTLCDEDITDWDANYKMSPPLRSRSDVIALKEALKDGTIDIIATDHAPHHADEKNAEFDKAPNGIVGLETALALALTELVGTGVLTPPQLVEKMSVNPAKLMGLGNKGRLSVGADADVTIIDPEAEYAIDKGSFVSKGRNTPFQGRAVKGRAVGVIVGGEIIV